MNQILFDAFGITVTPWKLLGFAGVALFAARWVVQLWASRSRGRPVLPLAFWLMSIGGSVLLVLYFAFGSGDPVGLLSNLFPAAIATYNLLLDVRHRRGGHVAHIRG